MHVDRIEDVRGRGGAAAVERRGYEVHEVAADAELGGRGVLGVDVVDSVVHEEVEAGLERRLVAREADEQRAVYDEQYDQTGHVELEQRLGEQTRAAQGDQVGQRRDQTEHEDEDEQRVVLGQLRHAHDAVGVGARLERVIPRHQAREHAHDQAEDEYGHVQVGEQVVVAACQAAFE